MNSLFTYMHNNRRIEDSQWNQSTPYEAVCCPLVEIISLTVSKIFRPTLENLDVYTFLFFGFAVVESTNVFALATILID